MPVLFKQLSAIIPQTLPGSGKMTGSQLWYKFFHDGWPHNPATRIWSALTSLVTSKPFPELIKTTAHPAAKSKYGLAVSEKCPCGSRQTLLDIVISCPQSKLEDGLQRLYSADDVAVQWLMAHGSWMHKTTRHRATTSMYSLTFCVRVMLPERRQWKPAVQAAAVMLRTHPPPVHGQSPASQPRPLPIYGAQFREHPRCKMKETSLTPDLSLLPPIPKACEELISCTCLEQNFAVVRIPYIASCICKTSGEPCEPCRNMTFWETVDMGIKVTVVWHRFRPFKRLCTCTGVRICFQITFWTTQYTYWLSLFSVLLTKSLIFYESKRPIQI